MVTIPSFLMRFEPFSCDSSDDVLNNLFTELRLTLIGGSSPLKFWIRMFLPNKTFFDEDVEDFGVVLLRGVATIALLGDFV